MKMLLAVSMISVAVTGVTTPNLTGRWTIKQKLDAPFREMQGSDGGSSDCAFDQKKGRVTVTVGCSISIVGSVAF
jgi:hypothetical protein